MVRSLFKAPERQDWLMDRMKALGYFPDELGICFGISNMASQALLLKDINSFDLRLKKIHDIPLNSFASYLNEPAQKDLLIDIIAFFDGIELYQQLFFHDHLVSEPKKLLSQNSINSARLTLCKPLEEQGGLRILKKFCGIYCYDDLHEYLDTLLNQLTIEQNENESSVPFSILLPSYDHIITLSLAPKSKTWFFIDANQLPTKRIWDINHLCQLIVSTFSKNGIISMNTDILCTQSNSAYLSNAFNGFIGSETWKKLHSLGSYAFNLVDSDNVSWFHIAVEMQHHSLVKKLLPFSTPQINQLNSSGTHPLIPAISQNDLRMVRILTSCKHIDINVRNKEDSSALCHAIEKNYLSIAHLLIKHPEVDVNLSDKKGVTALYLAINNKAHTLTAALLDHPHIDVNATLVDGRGPLYLAAERGDLPLIKKLIHKGAKIDFPYIDEARNLRLYVATSGLQAKKRLHQLIMQKQKQGEQLSAISIKPHEIAWIKRHYSVMHELISEQERSLLQQLKGRLTSYIRRVEINYQHRPFFWRSPHKLHFAKQVLHELNNKDVHRLDHLAKTVMADELNQIAHKIVFHLSKLQKHENHNVPKAISNIRP